MTGHRYKQIAETIINYNRVANYQSTQLDYVVKQIELSNAQPESFLASNERGLDKTDDILWFTLIDALIETGYALEFDWKSDSSDILWGVRALFEKQQISLNLKIDTKDENKEAGEILYLLNQKINKISESTLVNLDIDSDSYITILVKKDALNILKKIDKRITAI